VRELAGFRYQSRRNADLRHIGILRSELKHDDITNLGVRLVLQVRKVRRPPITKIAAATRSARQVLATFRGGFRPAYHSGWVRVGPVVSWLASL
jgi:hypothetical protein